MYFCIIGPNFEKNLLHQYLNAEVYLIQVDIQSWANNSSGKTSVSHQE